MKRITITNEQFKKLNEEIGKNVTTFNIKSKGSDNTSMATAYNDKLSDMKKIPGDKEAVITDPNAPDGLEVVAPNTGNVSNDIATAKNAANGANVNVRIDNVQEAKLTKGQVEHLRLNEIKKNGIVISKKEFKKIYDK